MKRLSIIAATIATLVLAAPAATAPPPGIEADPYTNYAVTRVLPNGTEKLLETFLITSWDSQEQAIRQVALDYARLQRTNNPSWVIMMYGPIDPPLTYWTDDDRIWSSFLLDG